MANNDPAQQPADGVDAELVGRLVEQARAAGLQRTGEGGLLQQLTKRVLESALEGEITDHLGYDKGDPARKNDRSNGAPAPRVWTRPGTGPGDYRVASSTRVPEHPTGTVYALAQIAMHDRERYDRYVAAFMPILVKYRGRLLAADESPQVAEGLWPYDKVILMAFDDRESYERWAYSPEYQEISKDRVAATQGVVLLVNGIPSTR